MSATHIAGPVISIGLRQIQRCAVCGLKMVDNLAFIEGRVGMVRTCDSVEMSGPGFWEGGGLVRFDGNHQMALPHEDGAPVPTDCCIDLVEGD